MSVPVKLRESLGKRELKWSLHTRDHGEAKRLYPAALAIAQAQLASARQGATPLSYHDCHALAGQWYLTRTADQADSHPGDAIGWELAINQLVQDAGLSGSKETADDILEPATAIRLMGKEADALLRSECLNTDSHSRTQLASSLVINEIHFRRWMLRRAEGDFGADPRLSQLPDWKHPREQAKPSTDTVSLMGLFEAWADERMPANKTRYEWRIYMQNFLDFIGHDDVARVSKGEVVAWKDSLVKAGLSSKTINEARLASLSCILNWAVTNDRLASNPADRVKAAVDREGSKLSKRRGYTDEETQTLLQASRKEQGFLRWGVWLMAYTGARVEEVAGAMAKDVRIYEGIVCLDINPHSRERSLKNAVSERIVPLHSHLIDEGFNIYVKSLPKDGPLFPEIPISKRSGKRGDNATRVVSPWVRNLGIMDKRIGPAHSWRHRFADLCRTFRIPKELRIAITGHSSRDIADAYGSGHPIRILSETIEKIERQLP